MNIKIFGLLVLVSLMELVNFSSLNDGMVNNKGEGWDTLVNDVFGLAILGKLVSLDHVHSTKEFDTSFSK